MRSHTNLRISLAVFLLPLFVVPKQSLASPGQIIFDDAANAKIARLKTKARVLKNTRKQDVVPSALGAEAPDQEAVAERTCGSIEIANQKKPNIGRPQKATEVFILGDVINTGNNCN